MRVRNVLQALFDFFADPGLVIGLLLIVALIAFLTGCAGIHIGGQEHVAQTCPDVQEPVLLNYVNDAEPGKYCGGAPWGACTDCRREYGLRICTIHGQGKPNELGPDVLADEAQHVFGCKHLNALPTS